MTLSASAPLILGAIISTSTLFFYLLDTHLVRKKVHAKLFKLKANKK